MTLRFEQELARSGRLVYTTMGRSMLPMLRQKRDLVVLERPQGRLKKLDVALYRDGAGKYILHRVVRVEADGYVFRGDNNAVCEYGVGEDQIVGVLTAFVRDGREISVRSAGYRAYARLWCALYVPRQAVRKLRGRLGRIRRRWRRGQTDGT